MPRAIPIVSGRSARKVLGQQIESLAEAREAILHHTKELKAQAETIAKIEKHLAETVDPHRLQMDAMWRRRFWMRLWWLVSGR